MERNDKPEQELSGTSTGFTGLICRENDGFLELWDAATATWSPLKMRFTAGKPVWHPGLLNKDVAFDQPGRLEMRFVANSTHVLADEKLAECDTPAIVRRDDE